MIDYRDLLKKYIRHVMQSEGSTFLGTQDVRQHCSERLMTAEERAELVLLDREVGEEGWWPGGHGQEAEETSE